jgi:pilus assembly protein CpaE
MTQAATLPSPAPASPKPAVLLPRLAMHAFCEDERTAGLIRDARTDRRLTRAHITVQMGGVHQACSFYEKAPTPDLIVVESLLAAADMLADLERLADVCEPETKVLVIGHINDVLLYRELMRRGVSEYLVAPAAPADIAESITGIYADEPTRPPGRVMAFIGAKGGAGSSTCAHNVGWTLADTMANVAVIADLDLAFGTAGLNFNQDPPQGTAQALADADRLDELSVEKLLSRCSDRLSLLGATCDLSQGLDIAPDAATRLVEVLSRSAANVILDLPRQWSPWLRQFLIQADDVVITAEPDLANLRNTKNLLDSFADQRSRERPAVLVLNKVNVPRRPEIGVADFAAAVGLSPAAVIEFEPALFGAGANNGLMIGEVSCKAKATEQFRALTAVLARRTALPEREEGFLAPILARIARLRSAG